MNHFVQANRKIILKRGLVFFFAVAALSIFQLKAHAQGYGSIAGTVTDPSGAVVPNVSVIATASQTGVQTKAVTNAQGEFTFPTLLPTEYAISVTASGFKLTNSPASFFKPTRH